MVKNHKNNTNHYYTKSFNSLKEGYRELINILNLDKNVFKDFDNDSLPDDNDAFYQAMFNHLVKFLSGSNFPSVMSPDYPNTYAFSLYGDNFFFRTKDNFSFSWEYDRDSMDAGQIKVNFYVSMRDQYKPFLRNLLKNRCNDLERMEWEKTTAGSVFSRGKRFHNNKKEKKADNGNTIGEKVSKEEIKEMELAVKTTTPVTESVVATTTTEGGLVAAVTAAQEANIAIEPSTVVTTVTTNAIPNDVEV